jgi:hypothetical protein
MEVEIGFSDILLAFEPTGFLSGAPLILGLLALTFVSTLFAMFIYMLRFRILPVWQRADEFESMLDQLEKDHPEPVPEVLVWDGPILELISKSDWLAPQWEDFRGQCWVRGDEVYTFDPPSDFFHHILPPPKGFAASVPGLLTAVGILGTFIGIVIGLAQIGGQMGGESEQLRAAMGNLISSLGVSFRTSIWGLILSMVCTITNSFADSKLEAQRDRWLSWLEKTMRHARIHDLAVEQLNQAEEQTRLTEKLIDTTGNMGETVAGRIERAISGGDGHGGLVGAVENMAKMLGENQQDGMKQLVESFMEKMNQQMGDDFSQLGDALREMVTANQDFQSSMRQLVDHLQNATSNQGEASSQMESAIANAASAIAEMQESFSSLGSVTSTIQEAAGSMQAMLSQQNNASGATQDTIQQLMAGLQSQSSSWLDQQQSIGDATSDIRDQLQGMAEAVKGLVQWHDRIKTGLGTQIELLMKATEAQKVVSEKMTAERKEASAIAENIAKIGSSVAPAAQEMVKAGDAIRKASEGLFSTEKAVGRLTTKLEDASSELTDRQIQAIDEYSKIAKGLKAILQKLGGR